MTRIKAICAIAIAGIATIQSCKESTSPLDPIVEVKKEVAVEVFQEKRTVKYAEPINIDENEEFFKGAYIQNLPKALISSKSEQIDGYDVIDNADEVPMVSMFELAQTIFTDGSYTYSSLDRTPDEMNFLENLHSTQLSPSERAYRTEIVNNVLTLYSQTGEQMKSETIGEINFKPMLDSLRAYLASQPNPTLKSTEAANNKALCLILKYVDLFL
jgi:hypothetical protein